MQLRVASSIRVSARSSAASRSWARRSVLAGARHAGTRSYVTPASTPKNTPVNVPASDAETARVWDSIQNLDEDWDPAWDNELPENEHEGIYLPIYSLDLRL